MRIVEIVNRCAGTLVGSVLSPMSVVVAIAIILGVVQVSGQGGKQGKIPARVKAPEWYDKIPVNDSTLIARGRGDSKDQQVAIDKAVATARSGLAATVDRRWKELMEAIRKEGGIAAVQSEETVTLEGSKVVMQKTSKRGRIWTVFVLVAVPKSSARSVLSRRLHRDEEWYAKVKETKAVQEYENSSP